MDRTQRGQGATEYLVILAAVLVIALIVIYVLSTSTSIGGQNTQAMSQSYWSSLTPFAITDSSQTSASPNVAKISIQNTGSRELTMNQLTLSTTGSTIYVYSNTTSTVFLPGQKRVMSVNLDANVVNCASYIGKSPNTYSIFISYDDDPITGKIFNSTTKTLAITCSS